MYKCTSPTRNLSKQTEGFWPDDVNDDDKELIYYVDDVVLFKEGNTEEEAISGRYKYLIDVKHKFTEIGQ
eukprot:13003407-Heterocapsa_arctica.AAC.1